MFYFDKIKSPAHSFNSECTRLLWWREMDSNHRSQRQQIYSLPPLATREPLHMELADGIEPPTC